MKNPSELTGIILEKAITVHRNLGPGLLESSYSVCLAYELERGGLFVEKEKSLPVTYQGIQLDGGYRIDLLVEQQIIIEIKAVDKLVPLHLAQILTYLRLADLQIGFLLNFNAPIMKEGIKRVVNNFKE